ncbi:hypothetical protein M0804_013740 [Polistes exclamans]|nr:hypothetical protein M0804_013740 [Polistes exclamans]
MSQEQRRIRPDTLISLEAVIEQTSRNGTLRNKRNLIGANLRLKKREQRLALLEEEMRKSLGVDFFNFRGFERTDPPVDSPVPLSITPSSSRPISPKTALRRRTITPLFEGESELKTIIEDLRRKIREMRTIAQIAPLPHLSQSLFKLRELTEHVPNFDGQNISLTQFTRACRRAF